MQSTTSPPVLAIACGGTGGHFFPGLTIAREFKKRGGQPVLFVGGHHAPDQIKVAREMGIQAVSSAAVRIPQNKLFLPFAGLKLLRCVKENRELMRRYGVTMALGMGSFASAPMALAANKEGIPLYLHEGNAMLGRANRFLSKKAEALFLSFPLANGEKTRIPQIEVGMPVRSQLRQSASRAESEKRRLATFEKYELDPERPVLLVFGGSQGASFLNELLPSTMNILPKNMRKFQLVHLTGSRRSSFEIEYQQMGIKAHVDRRDRRIDRLYRIADLVICRAGASTIFELALFGKPAILVPFPAATDDHQLANARYVESQGGAIVKEEKELDAEELMNQLIEWHQNPQRYIEMAANIRKLARPDAALTIIDHMAEHLEKLGRPLVPQPEVKKSTGSTPARII